MYTVWKSSKRQHKLNDFVQCLLLQVYIQAQVSLRTIHDMNIKPN